MLLKVNNFTDISGVHSVQRTFNAVIGKPRNMWRVGEGPFAIDDDVKQAVRQLNFWCSVQQSNIRIHGSFPLMLAQDAIIIHLYL